MESWIRLATVIIAGLALLGGLAGFFHRLRADRRNAPEGKRLYEFGSNSLKALGIVIFLPTLLILGISTHSTPKR